MVKILCPSDGWSRTSVVCGFVRVVHWLAQIREEEVNELENFSFPDTPEPEEDPSGRLAYKKKCEVYMLLSLPWKAFLALVLELSRIFCHIWVITPLTAGTLKLVENDCSFWAEFVYFNFYGFGSNVLFRAGLNKTLLYKSDLAPPQQKKDISSTENWWGLGIGTSIRCYSTLVERSFNPMFDFH